MLCANSLSIHVLHRNNLCSILRPLYGFTSRVFLARIKDEGGVKRMVLAFAFPRGSRGLANMVIWWLCKHAVGCANQERACWFIKVPGDLLADHFPDCEWPAEITCWAVAEIPGAQPDALPTVMTEGLRNHLQAWAELPKVIGLNDILCHSSPSPVMRVTGIPAQYVALDGAQIIGGEFWRASDLPKMQGNYNHLARMSGYVNEMGIPNPQFRGFVRWSCRHFRVRLTDMIEAQRVLHYLLPGNEGEQVLRWIASRSKLERTRWASDRTPKNN